MTSCRRFSGEGRPHDDSEAARRAQPLRPHVTEAQQLEAWESEGGGACQGSCRFSHAAEALSFSVSSTALTTDSFSGLSVTAVMGFQLRV